MKPAKLTVLAKDLAKLARKHRLDGARLLFDESNDFLMISNGNILSYRQPKSTWTKLNKV